MAQFDPNPFSDCVKYVMKLDMFKKPCEIKYGKTPNLRQFAFVTQTDNTVRMIVDIKRDYDMMKTNWCSFLVDHNGHKMRPDYEGDEKKPTDDAKELSKKELADKQKYGYIFLESNFGSYEDVQRFVKEKHAHYERGILKFYDGHVYPKPKPVEKKTDEEEEGESADDVVAMV